MKYSVHAGLWMAQWTDPVEPIVARVAELGFDGVEVSMLDMTDEAADALGRAVRASGIELTLSDGLSPAADITSADGARRQAGIDYLRWAVRTAARAGARGIAGVLYAPWGVFDPDNKPARAARAAEALAALAPDLERHDVTLGLEAINRFETDLVNTAAEAAALARAAGTARVGVLLDSFHLNIEEKDIRAAIAGAADRLVHFHVSDNDRGVPGAGHLPWDQVRAGLADAGYDGWICAEMFVTAGNPSSRDLNIWRDIEPDADDAARRALGFMRERFG